MVAIALVVFFVFFNNPSAPPEETVYVPPTTESPTPTPTPTPSDTPPPSTPPTVTDPIDVPPERPTPVEAGWPEGRDVAFEVLNAGFSAYDPRVNMIEINQVLSYGFDTETAEYYVMTNFVAKKDTAVFVAFNEPVAQEIYLTSYLIVECNGRILGYMLPYTVTDDYTLHFQPKDLGGVGNWDQGAYTFRLFIDDVESAVRTANFFETMPMKVLAVPIISNNNGVIERCNGEWRDSSEWLIATFPVSRQNVEFILGPELDCSDSIYDVSTREGMRNVWQALVSLQTPNNDYTTILGFIRNKAGTQGRTHGWTYGLPASIIVETSPSRISVVPHEVAHCYSIGDEYEGGSLNPPLNMPPYGMSGHDIFTRRDSVATNPNVIAGFDVGINGSGSVIYEPQRPYYPGGWTALGPVTSFMSGISGAGHDSFWVSSEVWNHLFNVFAGNYGDYTRPSFCGVCCSCYADVFDPTFYSRCRNCREFVLDPDAQVADYTCGSCGTSDVVGWDNYFINCPMCDRLILWELFYKHNASDSQLEAVAGDTLVRAIQIKGILGTDGSFAPSPWYTYDVRSTELTLKLSGDFSVYFYDAAGNQLSYSYHDVNFFWQVTSDDGATMEDTDKIPINFAVWYPENAAKVVINKGDVEIYSIAVSTVIPQVSFTGLSENQRLGNSVTLTWEASGSTGNLFFEIWYSPSEGRLFNVAQNVTGRSRTVDLSSLPGSDEGYFIIYATDGITTGESTSPRVQVPYKAPIIFEVQTGIPGYKITQKIDFDARVYDLQDGWMYGDVFEGDDSNVIWYYEGKRYYHDSELTVFPYELAPGVHTFTIVARNSAGMTTEREYSFNIIDDESDLPDDWSRFEIQMALSWGITLPLDRLDAAVTRANYAEILTTTFGIFSYFVSDQDLSDDLEPMNPYPEYRPGVIEDNVSNWDLFHWFVPVALGVMDAPGGSFHPTGPVTQQEAAVMIYRIGAIALNDPDVLDPDADEETIINWFRELEIIDDVEDPDVFEATEKLSNRQTMVRTVRFIFYISMIYLEPYL